MRCGVWIVLVLACSASSQPLSLLPPSDCFDVRELYVQETLFTPANLRKQFELQVEPPSAPEVPFWLAPGGYVVIPFNDSVPMPNFSTPTRLWPFLDQLGIDGGNVGLLPADIAALYGHGLWTGPSREFLPAQLEFPWQQLPYPTNAISDVLDSQPNPVFCLPSIGQAPEAFSDSVCQGCQIIGGNDNGTRIGTMRIGFSNYVEASWSEAATEGDLTDRIDSHPGIRDVLDATVLLLTKIAWTPTGKTKIFPCTGTIFKSGVILTAHHCLQWLSNGKMYCDRRYEIQEIFAVTSEAVILPVEIPLNQACGTSDLDYALLQLKARVPGLSPLSLLQPAQDLDLISIHYRFNLREDYDPSDHSARIHRVVQDAACSVTNPRWDEVSFLHTCDTEGAASGSLLLSPNGPSIVGIHVAGKSSRANRAISIVEVAKELGENAGLIIK